MRPLRRCEKASITRVQELKERREELSTEFDRAQRAGDLERAAEIRYGTLIELGKQLESEEDRLAEEEQQLANLKGEQELIDVLAAVDEMIEEQESIRTDTRDLNSSLSSSQSRDPGPRCCVGFYAAVNALRAPNDPVPW